MNSGDLTSKQIETIQEQIRRCSLYFKALCERMESRRFDPDDEILKAARDAQDKVHRLWVKLHYLGFDASKRERERRSRPHPPTR